MFWGFVSMFKLNNEHNETVGIWENSKIIFQELKQEKFLRWAFFLCVGIGFYTYFISPYSDWIGHFSFLKECMFSFVSTTVFLCAAGNKRKYFFRKMGFFRLMGSALIGCIITFVFLVISVAILTSMNYEFSSTSIVGGGGGDGRSINYVIISSLIQLYGETMIIIFPFCFCMKILSMFMHWSKMVTVISLVFSGVCFGLTHYSTYDGNLIQLILVIGLSSVGFLITFLRVKNIHSAYLAHVFYDGILLFIPLLILQHYYS